MYFGKCNCGKVTFEVAELRQEITVCHCSQCRVSSGHQWAATRAGRFADLKFTSDNGLKWYASSDFAKRGFCKFCGSSLFYRMNEEEGVGIAIGCITPNDAFHVSKHIFVGSKAGYYDICDNAEQIEVF